jgi:predicted ATPase
VRARFEFTMQRAGVQRLRGEARAKKDAPASSFVGREPELDAMTAAYRRVLEDRTPVLVSVSGPPGIGKSRLVREAVAAVRAPSSASAAEPVVVEGRCEPFGVGQPLGVAAELGRALLKLPRDATLEQASAAIERRARLAGDTELLARLFANQPFPSGLDSARESLYLSLTELALGATSAAPCTLVVEDAQWSDPESMAWLDHLLSRAGGRPLFVLLAMRPAFWRDQAQRFLGRDHVRLELKPLARKATREIARALLGERATEELLDKLATQAAGSPLFAEELARISAAGKDATRAPTIEAAIQVSLDSLEDAVRDGVVRASVFGMRVWDLGAEAVGVFNPTPVLAKLVSAEVLVEEATSVFSSARQFMFKHALVRDVAYAMASDEQKKLLHAWAARWLDGIGEDAATVAQHFDLGGEREEAAIRWERAARRALATNSLVDAMKMAERALAFATTKEVGFARARLLDEAHSRLDARSAEREEAVMAMQEHTYDEESEIRTMGARARYDDARGKGGVEERLEEVVGRARALGLVDEEARCTATLANRYAFAGQLPKAEDEAARLLRLAERPQLEWAAVDAWQTLAVVRQTKGQLAAGVEARRAAAQAARAAGLQEREAVLTINLGFALITLGARQEALHEIESGIAKAQAIGSSGAVRHGRMNLLGWAATFGSDARLDAELAETRAVADEAAGAGWLMPDRATLGVLFYRGVELLRGDAPHLPRARALLKIAAESYRATQNRDVLPVALGFWAEAERKSGHADEANVLATEAASLVEGGAPSLLNEAPIFLALHDSCVDRGDFPGARRALERAMPALRRRLAGLEGTPYARSFVTQLPHNAALLAAAESYGSVPSDLQAMLDARR